VSVLRLHSSVDNPAKISQAIETLRGAIFQRPPLISAVKRRLRIRTIYQRSEFRGFSCQSSWILNIYLLLVNCSNSILNATWQFFGWIVKPELTFVLFVFILDFFLELAVTCKSFAEFALVECPKMYEVTRVALLFSFFFYSHGISETYGDHA
jgi:hypothetical protein